jgi:hypothetical protein
LHPREIDIGGGESKTRCARLDHAETIEHVMRVVTGAVRYTTDERANVGIFANIQAPDG